MTKRPLRLLAIDLTAKGFGFALVDKKLSLLDWGFSSMRAADDAALLARVSARIDRGNPTALVLENFAPTPERPTATRRSRLADQAGDGEGDRPLYWCRGRSSDESSE